jgi:hypothetical protein
MGWMVLCALAIGGCATPYKPYGIGGGYGEYKINDSTYVVSFAGNGNASRERVYYFWLYRCAQLTKASGYELFMIGPAMKPAVMTDIGESAQPAVYFSSDPARPIRVRGSAPTLIFLPGPKIQVWHYNGTVYMFHEPLAQTMPWAIDAGKVLAELQPYVTSNGNAPVPLPVDVLARAFVGHEVVHIGDGLKLGARPPGALPVAAASAALKPRSAADVQETMEGSLMLLFHQAYEAFRQKNLIDAAGSIHLAFDISPAGAISNCRYVSGTYPDSIFVGSIEDDAESVTFEASKVSTTRVTDFPITFAPGVDQ